MDVSTPEEKPRSAVVVTKLDFTYDGMDSPVLKKFDLDLPAGSRCLLIGQNGAGKSTLLRVLAGRHLTKPDDAVVVLDKCGEKVKAAKPNAAKRTVVEDHTAKPHSADIEVGSMMKKDQERYPERREELLNLLGVDPHWRMHQVSDGQRRRVQLLLGLVKPFKILLLDEITTSLDVVVRQDLLMWLHKESVDRGATIIYATHIFDGLDEWPTHLTYLTRDGSTGWQGKLEDLELNRQMKERGETCTLLKVAVHWLRGEQEQYRKETRENRHMRDKEEEGGHLAIQNKNPHLLACEMSRGHLLRRHHHHHHDNKMSATNGVKDRSHDDDDDDGHHHHPLDSTTAAKGAKRPFPPSVGCA
eukprot:jgi/Undpi1/8440/HiC_scaffold_25.g10908.m1